MVHLIRRLALLALLLASSGCASQPAVTSALPPSEVPAGSPAPAAGEIVVFAASSLTEAFEEMGERFKAANPGATVSFNFGASTQLATQLERGARADVFASADQMQLDRAKRAGRIEEPDAVLARNRLVVIAPASNPGGVAGVADLAKPGLKIVTSQPDVPVGIYTQDSLERMSRDSRFGPSFRDRVNANVVSREANVRQIVAKVQLGEADAAVVYRTDVTPQAAAQFLTLDIPDEFNPVATYPIAAVQDAPNRAGATAFIAFALSPAGQGILARWGFLPVGPAAS